MRLAAIILVLFLAGAANASGQRKKKPDPCANPQTQFEMNQCAGKAYQAADATLNQVYQKLMAMLDDEQKAQLKDAQNAWLKYRDAHCDFVGDQFKGGSMRPMIAAMCLADVTKNRTTELRGQIKDRNL
jgi:uncharacterized protein YecT (DUF1311 family)